MICVFDKNAKDFTTNGLSPLAPIKCEVTEILNGEYRLEMKHPYDDFGKWEYLQPGNIIKVPVPQMNTPRITLITKDTTSGGEQEKPGYVYTCITATYINDRPGFNLESTRLGYIDVGEEVIVLGGSIKHGDDYFYNITSKGGVTGYVPVDCVAYVRDLDNTPTGGGSSLKEDIQEVIPAKKIRDQPFRIYRVVHSLKEIAVYAKHIFYDLQDNMILKYAPDAALEGKKVAEGILSAAISSTSFSAYSSVTEKASGVVYENVNPADAFLNESDGFCARYHAEILRDWYDVYLVPKIGEESNITIADVKNLKSITYDADITDMANRIIPVGRDSSGNSMYLPESYIQSPDMQDDDIPRYITLDVPDAAVGEGMTQDEAYTKMRKAANAEFDAGTDSPVETVTVDYIDMTGIDEYKSIGLMDNIFLGDLVHVRARRFKRDFIKRMTQYKFDCLTQRYTKITLGTPYDIE